MKIPQQCPFCLEMFVQKYRNPQKFCSRECANRFINDAKRLALEDRRANIKKFEQSRGHSAKRGYDGNWRALRIEILGKEPNCRKCGAVAREVDHIIPINRGGPTVRENLQPLCKSCHSRKTGMEGRYERPSAKAQQA